MSIAILSELTRTKNTVTPQSQPIRGRETEMVVNNQGGYVFQIADKAMIERFLILGTIGGNYYAGERDLTISSINSLQDILDREGKLFVDTIVEVSTTGRAKNNDYALLALALAMSSGNGKTKRYAASKLSLVARTGTHLFHFVNFVTGMRGWGRVLKEAVAGWYSSKDTADLAYQMVKYQSRDGWSHRDILRLTHQNVGADQIRNNLFKWSVKGLDALGASAEIPEVIYAFEKAKTASKAELVNLITDYHLSHEMIPTEAKNFPEVWEALMPHMGATAMVRNLNKMTSIGLIKPLSDFSKLVYGKLNDEEFLKRGKVHPLQMLLALRQYSAGRGDKGSMVWTPDQNIVRGLNEGFYHSFKAVKSTGKNYMLGIDVSSSMSTNRCVGANNLSAAEGAAVMAMVTARVEPWNMIMGFCHTFVDLQITANDPLEVVMKKVQNRVFGSTDCSAAIQYARQNKLNVDAFCTYTDNETRVGTIHPSEALRQYRKEMDKPNAKSIVVGMSVSSFTIADPKDRNSLDVVGFDSNTPAAISEFVNMVV